ncbi:MAG: hypothetical protein GX021_09505 [Tissierellia bacterium]|nr:hypothetical protein [Tissierellia bacterium]
MKKTKYLALILILVFLLTGCSQSAANMDYDNFSNERVITYKHRKGDELNDYAAVILFEYEMDNYTKYQVSYLSCTCRAASENYQHLLYVEINNNNNSAEEATIRNIEYQFWGDSPKNPVNGITYEEIENELLTYLQYKSKAEIDGLNTLRDIQDAGQVERNGQMVDFVDAYTGATVSVDNTLAVLHALLDYHVNKYYK